MDADIVDECSDVIARADTPSLQFTCVPGGSPEECIDAISTGNADITTLGASAMPLAAAEDIYPIAAEFYGEEDGALTEYYAVAVVPESLCRNPSVNLGDLEGLRACHSKFTIFFFYSHSRKLFDIEGFVFESIQVVFIYSAQLFH